MEYLFSYGTLQQVNVQLATFGRKLAGEKDSLPGYTVGEIKISDLSVVQTSGKEYHPILQYTGKDSDTVLGTVFEMTVEELEQADTYEVEEYQRKKVELKSGKKVWIYAAREQ